MPFPPSPQTIPTCPTQFLYQLGQLYYYLLTDCSNGGTGYGTFGSQVPLSSCVDGDCVGSGSTPTSFAPALSMSQPIATSTRLANTSGKRDPYGRSRSFVKRFERELTLFRGRKSGPDDISERRHALADYLLTNSDGELNLQLIYKQPKAIRDALLQFIAEEFSTARIGGAAATEGIFQVPDQDLDIDTIGAGNINALFSPAAGVTATVADAVFRQGGTLSPYVKLRTKGNPQDPGDKDIFFRLQHVSLQLTAATTVTHYIGQQIDRDDLPIAANAIAQVEWGDRLSHFHVLKATPDGDTDERQYLVYSADDISAREYIA